MVPSFTSREANQDFARVKRAALNGLVRITDRGRPSLVVLTEADFERMTRKRKSLAEALSIPEVAGMDFDIPPLPDFGARPIDLD